MSENAQITNYKEQVKIDAEHLLVHGFPETILEINDLLLTEPFQKRALADIHTTWLANAHAQGDPPQAPKRPRTDPNSFEIRSNRHVNRLIGTVKPFALRLVEDAKVMKMWVAFMIPKIEDGNNFGVEIQEESFMMVQVVEGVARAFYDRIGKYYSDRAAIIEKISKAPHIEDYKRALCELDEKDYVGFCLLLTEIRNQYCSLHDIFLKNIEKIKKPRTYFAQESMY